MIIKRPQKIGLPKNPFQFNFSAYLYHKGISHQLYLSENDVILLDNTGGKNVVKFIIFIRKNLLALLNASDLSKDGKAVSSALLFGHKSDMNSELKQSFSRSGVIHILDAALSYYEVQQLDKECQHLNVKYYSLKKDKALIVNLKN